MTYMVLTSRAANTLMEVTKYHHQCSDYTGILRCCAILDALCQKAALYPLLKMSNRQPTRCSSEVVKQLP